MFASRILVNDIALFNSSGQNKLKYMGRLTVVCLENQSLRQYFRGMKFIEGVLFGESSSGEGMISRRGKRKGLSKGVVPYTD